MRGRITRNSSRAEEREQEVSLNMLEDPEGLILEEDNFFHHGFNNDNFDNFDVDESRENYGDIFDGLND